MRHLEMTEEIVKQFVDDGVFIVASGRHGSLFLRCNEDYDCPNCKYHSNSCSNFRLNRSILDKMFPELTL